MSFSEETIQKVWEKGRVATDLDANVWRKDDCKAWIRRNHYGERGSEYGWEIDHIKQESEGGGDELSNLRPLQWENNASRQAGHPPCFVTSSGNDNIRIKKML